MHPGRRNILIRWIGYAVVVAATAGWIYMDEPQIAAHKSDVLAKLAPKQIDLPSDQVTEAIQAAIKVSAKKVATFGDVEKIDPSLIVLDLASIDQKQVPLDVSTIFLGPPDKYAVLGGKIYKLGDVLPDGRTVQAIDPDGVTVAMGNTISRMPWIPPFKVELTGGPKTKERESDDTTPDGQGGDQKGADQGGQDVDLQNLPPDISPDQALEILQKIGKK